jgi:quercetin dioxygenase-like cupin family protein
MKVFRGTSAPFRLADPNSFTGPAHTKRLASDDAPIPVGIYHVKFEAGGRTNWHRHSGSQWLIIVDGRIRVQTWGEPAHDVEAGDAVVIHPGEKHWHGAAPGGRGAHVAVNVSAVTEWLEPVEDQP